MDNAWYLDKFQKGVELLDHQLFTGKQLEVKVGVWMDSVCLKIQKNPWHNHTSANDQSIFFSIWLSDEDIAKNKLCYNIHALKLRQLKGYKITSRDFAEAFRTRFKPKENEWPNVSTKFGPLTLMEGWVELDKDNLAIAIAKLANNIIPVAKIIDELLAERKV